MRKSKVIEAWNQDKLALGTLVKSVDPIHIEILSQTGLDFIWIDLEHSDKSMETYSQLARAARVGSIDILARPARWEYMRMGRMLEAGASGILYPRCESADEAREVIKWSKFHPLGERGFDGGSADNNYGQYTAGDYTQKANNETWIAIQIESPRAIPHAEAIAEIEGVDCLFFGPGDYSALSGMAGLVKDRSVLQAAGVVANAAAKAGKKFGTLVFDIEHSKYMQDLGAELLVHSADMEFYKHAYKQLIAEYETHFGYSTIK